MTTPAIEVSNVSVAFGDFGVLDGVSTTVDGGRLVGLVGPNGAGKTTLLRTINGALEPDRGTIRVAGRRLDRLSSRETSRLVATVPQSTASTFAFDVRRIVSMGRTPHVGRLHTRTAADGRAVETAMERAEVDHLADRDVTDVSGGERQRVFLARALAQDTPVLLLDEPTSDLDVNHQVRTLELVSDLVDEGRTVLAAIHDLDLAARYCDELRLLHGGRVRASGPPDSVLTGETVAAAFGTRAAVTRHPVTDTASVTAFTSAGDASGRVHVVGGGGTATPLLHRLADAGFDLSVGAVSTTDVDADTARALDGDLVTVLPHAPIDVGASDAVAERMRRADAVVVADVDVATGNRPNLTAALETETAVVAVDGRATEERNLAGATGRRALTTLRERSTLVAADGVVAAVREAVAEAESPGDRERVDAAGDVRR